MPRMSLFPPFNAESAHRKVKLAQNLWNTKDADKVVLAYTSDTIWRNRDQFLKGTEEIRE
jgi:nuclear transport factor 2 (NTF2) superfamily protein